MAGDKDNHASNNARSVIILFILLGIALIGSVLGPSIAYDRGVKSACKQVSEPTLESQTTAPTQAPKDIQVSYSADGQRVEIKREGVEIYAQKADVSYILKFYRG